MQLTDKIVIVTGASKGIGLATATLLIEEGARVVAVSRSTSAELAALGDGVLHVAADLTEPDAADAVVAAATQRFGRVDAVVNNAGGPPPGTTMPVFGFLGRTDADWRAMLDFNLLAAVRMCRAALPLMLQVGAGAIVNVSSTHAVVPSAVNVDYGASKAALRNLTQALAEEFGPQGIRVNGVCPGPVLTPWWTEPGGAADVLAARLGTTRDEVLSDAAPRMMALTTGRLVDPDEVAAVIALLVSERSAGTMGTDVRVDGGLVKAI